MNTRQLDRILSNDSRTSSSFIGVHARDSASTVLNRALREWKCSSRSKAKTEAGTFEYMPRLVAFMANTDDSWKPGRHWVAYILDFGAGSCEFFDSYGCTPTALQMPEPKRGLTIKCNTRRLQSFDSNVCGQYCVYYITQRCGGRKMTDIINDFSLRNYKLNDYVVYNYVRKRYRHALSCCSSSNLCQSCVCRSLHHV